jgi:homospermidine synthase
MTGREVHVKFAGKIVFVGFGSIGQGVLPLILRHIGTSSDRLTIVTAEEKGRSEAEKFGVKFVKTALTRENYRKVLEPLLQAGDFLLNLSVDVSSVALIQLARERGALYLDTCVEPWAGGYVDPKATVESRSNYTMRLEALALRDGAKKTPTAVLTHGANPGLVSHLVKQALLNIAKDTGVDAGTPGSRESWAKLAQALGIKVMHIAERDTQVTDVPKEANEFVNTWSVDGFVSEGAQPAELGWGTHEKHFPADGGRHTAGSRCAIYLNRPGAHLDSGGGSLSRLPDHAFGSDFAGGLLHGHGRRPRRVPADQPLRLPSERQRGVVRARIRGQQLAPTGS